MSKSVPRDLYITIHGMKEWYKAMFEKLGWMILARENDHADKVETYKNSVNRLEKAIRDRIPYVSDKDKKMDLLIMLNNIKVLKSHVRNL